MIRMLSADDKLAEIKRLYYQTTRATIKADFAKAIDLLKSMSTEEERERVAVLHGRPVADAIGLGKAGEKPDAENEKRKRKNE